MTIAEHPFYDIDMEPVLVDYEGIQCYNILKHLHYFELHSSLTRSFN